MSKTFGACSSRPTIHFPSWGWPSWTASTRLLCLDFHLGVDNGRHGKKSEGGRERSLGHFFPLLLCQARPASRGCNLYNSMGPRAQKSPTLGLMLCCCRLEILNHFWTGVFIFTLHCNVSPVLLPGHTLQWQRLSTGGMALVWHPSPTTTPAGFQQTYPPASAFLAGMPLPATADLRHPPFDSCFIKLTSPLWGVSASSPDPHW